MASMGIVSGRIYTSGNSVAPLSYRQLQGLKGIGVTTIRVEFEDRGGDRPDYVAAYKNIIKSAGSLGISVIGVLSWNSMKDQSVPVSAGTFEEFDRDFVIARFFPNFDWHDATYSNVDGSGFGVDGWEIWNEPDVYDFKLADGRFLADRFALLCVRVYEKTRNPSIQPRKIIIGGISRMDDSVVLKSVFDSTPIRNFKAAQGANVLPGDAIGIHGYGSTKRPSRVGYAYQGGTFTDQINFFFGLRDSANRPLIPPAQPIYMTEVGYGSTRLSSGQINYLRQGTQAQEAKYVFQTLAQYPRFQRVYWYSYRDDEKKDAGDPRGDEWYGIRSVPQANCGNGGIKLLYNTIANLSGRAGVGQSSMWEVIRAGDEGLSDGDRVAPPCGAGAGTNPFLAAFIRTDGAENILGYPGDNGGGSLVHAWGNAMVQDFKGALWNQSGSAILSLENGASVAAAVFGRFWEVWMTLGGGPGVGFPFDNGGGVDRHQWDSAAGDTGYVQDLRKGGQGHNAMLTWETTPVPGRVDKVFIVTQPILGKYLAGGGVGAFGYPRSERYWNGSRFCQNFARGGPLCE